MSWVEQPLEMIAKCELGKMLDKKKNKGEYKPYLSNVDVRWGFFEMENLKDMRFESREFERYSLKVGDIVMCEGGEAGRCALWKGAKSKMMYQKALHRIRTKENIECGFLFYQFLNMGNNGEFEPYYTGATIKHLPLQILKSIPIIIPPLPTQKRIADILSAYDDLIENNLKRIKLLEQAAQNIYKEWFVNLRFPGHENTPLNEDTSLPKGWANGIISDFGKVVTGKTPSTKKPEFYGGNIPFVKTPDMHDSCYVTETTNNLTTSGAETQMNKNLPKNSVMVSCIGTAGVVAMTSKVSQTNQQINSVVFDSPFKSYYFYCFATRLKELLEGLGSRGATMVNVNKGKFENIQILIPSEEILRNYSSKVEPMFNQILTLLSQNQKLKVARDILLPRLMNRTIVTE